MKTMTLTVCRRPIYTRRTIEALLQCDGISDYAVGIVVDPQCDETLRVVHELTAGTGWSLYKATERLGCNRAILTALHIGFVHWKSDYHVHLEDDTVPAPDCLRWFEWARKYGANPEVFNVAAYSRDSDGAADEARARRWFTPWGWATWRDRFDECASRWAGPNDWSWDISVNHVFRGDRCEIYPALARTTNIGADLGEHATPELWNLEQRNDRWAGATGDRCSEWRFAAAAAASGVSA